MKGSGQNRPHRTIVKIHKWVNHGFNIDVICGFLIARTKEKAVYNWDDVTCEECLNQKPE